MHKNSKTGYKTTLLQLWRISQLEDSIIYLRKYFEYIVTPLYISFRFCIKNFSSFLLRFSRASSKLKFRKSGNYTHIANAWKTIETRPRHKVGKGNERYFVVDINRIIANSNKICSFVMDGIRNLEIVANSNEVVFLLLMLTEF